jgi:hypothetical protein
MVNQPLRLEEITMTKIHYVVLAALMAASATAIAAPASAPAQSVNLDGSVSAHSQKGPTLAAVAGKQLEQANVPSTRTDPVDVKAAADADMNKRGDHPAPRLKAERQNLTGKDAAAAIARQKNPSTLDHEMANGDIDHTEQVTNLKVYLKK